MLKTRQYPLLFIMPILLIYTLFYIVPSLSSFYFALTDWNYNTTSIDFIGLDNFTKLFKEDNFLLATKNTLIYSVAITIGQNLFGLVLALILNEKLRNRNILRAVFFMPVIICTLVVGFLFTSILQPEYGIVNTFLRSIGLDIFAKDWLGDPRMALFSIIMTDLWRISGFAMIIYLTGLQTIPKELMESSLVDGTSYMQKVRHIIFPLIAQSFTVNFLLSLIGSLKVFDIVFALTGGGPGYSTEVFNTFVYRNYSQGYYGYSTAAGLVLFAFVAIISMITLYFLKKREIEL